MSDKMSLLLVALLIAVMAISAGVYVWAQTTQDCTAYEQSDIGKSRTIQCVQYAPKATEATGGR
jgi:hypothetical protein